MSNFKKDNTGYHLKHLFIGSEGTLGFISKVAIQCPTLSRSINVAFLGLKSFENVQKTFLAAKQDLGEIMSSCEMIDKDSLGCSSRYLGQAPPIGDYPFYMLIETSGSNSEHDEEKLLNFLNSAMEKNLVVDGTTTNDIGKMRVSREVSGLIIQSLKSLFRFSKSGCSARRSQWGSFGTDTASSTTFRCR